MSELIETRRFLKKTSVELFSNHLIVKESSPFESNEFELTYEEIERKKTVETKANFVLLAFSFLAGIVGLLFLIGNTSEVSPMFFIISLVLLLTAFATKSKLIIIKSFTGQNLNFYFSNRNKNSVIVFCDKLIATVNDFLLNKYSRIDKDLPIDNQLENLIFLRDRQLLSEEKFEQLKNQLLGKENKTTIGYR